MAFAWLHVKHDTDIVNLSVYRFFSGINILV